MNPPLQIDSRFGTLIAAAFFALISGCGNGIAPASVTLAQSEIGRFSSDYCFLNKLASEGFQAPVYTKASLEFASNGTGTSAYELYFEDTCTNLVMSGENALTYTISHQYDSDSGTISVLQIDQQNDPSDPSNTIRYWIPALVEAAGVTIDIDYRDGDSAPFTTEPVPADFTAFQANPHGEGVLFQRGK